LKNIRSFLLSLSALFLGSRYAYAEPLELGSAVPALKTTDQTGKKVDLGKELSEGFALVYFYPKADTPGCTRQACNIRDAFAAVAEAGIKVFGVSADTEEAQSAFARKHKIPFSLLADKKGDVIAAFGVPVISAIGLASRQSFLFKDGKLIWRDLKAKPATQAQDAIAAARGNS
jgi:thioredoxin-dependent peroxiredoxin